METITNWFGPNDKKEFTSVKREIKFRAWDGKKIIKPVAVDQYGRWSKNLVDDNWQSDGLMQYTGFKDKNGEDIYEGDILKARTITEIVEFMDGSFGICINKRTGFYRLYKEMASTFEIIGNIYQNPDLIKK